ncbi:MAG: FecR domain-containing protein [Ramlibacter sp.]|nr:FecR domain-containing protein [Ramlibacter sp.]
MKTSKSTGASRLSPGSLPGWPLLFVGLACLAASAQAQQVPGAGSVVFVSGPAQLIAADGTRNALQVGAQVRQGDQVTTGKDGYVHVRMIDSAFVAVRPESKFAVELYEYDAANPAASRIKLNLHNGNTRTVSGKGGEAARQNYRFNTPMAAIGLRGTDYTVVASDTTTRVSVSRGAVAVTPLGGGCTSATLGPCATGSTRELNASLSHAYLEVNARNVAPVLVRPEQDPQGSSGQHPVNRPEEPRAESTPGVKLADSKDAANQVAADRLAGGLSAPLPTPVPVPAPVPVQPPVETVPPPPAVYVWGRWSTYAGLGEGAPAVGTLMDGKRQAVVGNDVFALLRSGALPNDIPAQGAFSFKLAGSEAYTLSNGVLAAAQVTGGTFGVDFSQRTFNTTLAVAHAQGAEQLSALGKVQFQGLLVADPSRSNMNLGGAVAGNGMEAAYLFDKQLSSGGLLGAVRWVR